MFSKKTWSFLGKKRMGKMNAKAKKIPKKSLQKFLFRGRFHSAQLCFAAPPSGAPACGFRESYTPHANILALTASTNRAMPTVGKSLACWQCCWQKTTEWAATPYEIWKICCQQKRAEKKIGIRPFFALAGNIRAKAKENRLLNCQQMCWQFNQEREAITYGC